VHGRSAGLVEHDWLIEPLGLKAYHLVRRHYGDRLIDFPRIQPARLFGRWGADSEAAAANKDRSCDATR
jgi:hypothetical protein